MLDKKDTTLIKLDCKSKDKVYDMLFGKADACLKNAKTVALLYLGSPYYMTRALEEYNIEEVNIFTTKDFKFIYEPFENAERVKIWYVDNVKDTFKECDMKFDCIIMNPPYQRNLHLKILAEAIKHLKDEKSVCVNLSPVFMRKNELNQLRSIKEFLFKRIISQTEQSASEMDKVFGIYGTADLAVTVFSKEPQAGVAFPTGTVEQQIVAKIRNRHKAKSIRTMIWKTNGQFEVPVQGDYGYAKRWHYTLEAMLSGNPNAKMKFVSKEEADNFVKTTTTTNIYKFMYVVDDKAAIPAHLPFMGNAINPRTKLKGYTGEWTDDDLYKFFNITSAEQKVIEETMEKYS